MYDQFYELAALPFENTANPRLFYASEHHREALAAIEYTIRLRKGIVLITGPVGSGKTTVSRTVVDHCSQTATIIDFACGSTGGVELIRHVLRSLDVSANKTDGRTQMLQTLRDTLMQRSRDNRPVVLLVDEAQTLSNKALEQLRLLTNLDTATSKLLQLVLVGQPELRERIGQPELSALRQRIVMARQIHPLNVVETRQYIDHRLQHASLDPECVKVRFDTEAVEAIHQHARGLPRVINVVCDSCLLLGFVKQSRQIDRTIVTRVLDDMIPSLADQNHNDDYGQTPFSLAGNF